MVKKKKPRKSDVLFFSVITQVTRGRDQAHPVTPRFFMHVITITQTSNGQSSRDLRSFVWPTASYDLCHLPWPLPLFVSPAPTVTPMKLKGQPVKLEWTWNHEIKINQWGRDSRWFGLLMRKMMTMACFLLSTCILCIKCVKYIE